MKKIFLVIAVFISLQSFAQFKDATLQASGLTCSLCSKAIYKSLMTLPFVKDVKPNIQNSSFDISFKEGSVPDFDAMGKAVMQAGFSVSQLKVRTNFNDVAVQNDTHVKLEGKTLHFLNVKNQTLKGERTMVLVDKNFVSSKENKKYGQFTTMKCFTTGVMENCCDKKDGAKGERVYHVTVI